MFLHIQIQCMYSPKISKWCKIDVNSCFQVIRFCFMFVLVILFQIQKQNPLERKRGCSTSTTTKRCKYHSYQVVCFLSSVLQNILTTHNSSSLYCTSLVLRCSKNGDGVSRYLQYFCFFLNEHLMFDKIHCHFYKLALNI